MATQHISTVPQSHSIARVRGVGAGLGVLVFGFSCIALGVIGLYRGDFTIVWHPVPDALQRQAWLAYGAALMFVLGGLGTARGRPLPAAPAILCTLFLLFALSWARRVFGFPLMIGTWVGFAEQIALALGAIAAILTATGQAGAAVSVCRITFGLCELAFGLGHCLSLSETVAMTPAWLPLGQTFWAIATGIAHLLGAAALIFGRKAALAARLLVAMFLMFSALVWAPMLLADLHSPIGWAGNAINLAMVGAVWALADLLAAREPALSRGTSCPSARDHGHMGDH